MGNGDMGSSIHPRQDPVDHVLVVLMYLCLIQDDAAMTKHGGVECERLAALPTDVRVRVNVNVYVRVHTYLRLIQDDAAVAKDRGVQCERLELAALSTYVTAELHVEPPEGRLDLLKRFA